MKKELKKGNLKKRRNKGFTLLEILLVIAAIGILAGIVIVAINPLRQIAKVRQAERASEINQLNKAIEQYNIAEGKYPDALTIGITEGEYREICNTGKLDSEADLVAEGIDCSDDGEGNALLDLRVLVPTYVAEIPKDSGLQFGIGENIIYKIAEAAGIDRTGYLIGVHPENKKVSIKTIEPDINGNPIALNPIETPDGGGGGGDPLSPSAPWAPIFAKSLGSEFNDATNDLVVDNLGNSYIIGSYSGNPFTFGNDINSNPISISPIGNISSFIAKYDSTGDLIWVKNIGGTNGEDNVRSITLDSSNNIYITGGFGSSTLPLGNDINSNPITLTNSGASLDIFIIKYNSNGDLIWGKSSGSAGRSDMGNSIESDSSGNIYITGQYASTTLTLGEGGNQVNLTNAGIYNDIFTAKYDTDGNLLWAKTAGGTGFIDNGDKLSVDDSGNVYVVGTYNSATLSFGNDINSNPISISPIGNISSFIAKYNSTGDLLWAKKIGGNGPDDIRGIKVDSIGNLYIVGMYRSNILSFGNDINDNPVNLTKTDADDAFIARYNIDGDLIWSINITGSGDQHAISVDIDSQNNIYITGFLANTINLGNDLDSTPVNLTSLGYANGYIAKYNNLGQVLNSKLISSDSRSEGQLLYVGSTGDVHLVGIFNSYQLDLGNDINENPLSIFNQGGNPEGYSDEIFLFKLNKDF